MNYDITISFDKASYLNPEIYMLIDSLKDNISNNTILHVVTNRNKNDPIRKYIKENIPSKFYFKSPPQTLQSRCKMILNAFQIKSDKDWILKIDVDNLSLNKLDFDLDEEKDIYIQPENRRIILDDNVEERIWRIIYKNLGVELPKTRIPSIEGKEMMMPLYNTGTILINKKLISVINNEWIPMTEICERWIHMGIHPNEFAMTALMKKHNMNIGILPEIYNWNPIAHFRDGEFPSTKLIAQAKTPDNIKLLHYHKPKWLQHLMTYNEEINTIVSNSQVHIPDKWWDLSNQTFQEKL
jgi:hypothetical protein